MKRKFVSLSSNSSPSENPYKVKTYIHQGCQLPSSTPSTGDQCKKVESVRSNLKISCPANSTIGVILSIEERVKRFKDFQEGTLLKKNQKKASYLPQRKPSDLTNHAKYREDYLRLKEELKRATHKVGSSCQLSAPNGVIELKDPKTWIDDRDGKGGVTLEVATPEGSQHVIYKPPKRVLKITRPKSGYHCNEKEEEMKDISNFKTKEKKFKKKI